MSLNANYTFVGNGNWSIDGVGGQATGGGIVSAIVPEGSRVEAAFLYGSTYFSGTVDSATLSLGDDTLTVSDFDALGVSGPTSLQGYRADITAFIREAVGDGDEDVFDFNLDGISGLNVDGFALVIVYSNPDESLRTIALLDGFSNPDGDEFALGFDEPVDTDQDGFEALLSLGIGFGFQGGEQYSQVTVDSRPLTTSAGGSDDGRAANGGLLTIGGIGDDPANPDPGALPDGDPRIDDELYDLAQGNSVDAAPFLADGAESISVTTLNPSDDDNIFFAGFNITAVVAVDTDENDAPVAASDMVTVLENGMVMIAPLANDFDPDDGDSFTLSGFDASGLVGNLTDNGDGTFTYDPNGAFDALNEGESATTSFSYTITDGELSSSATVTITVNGVGGDTPPPPPGDCPTIDRPGTVDGSGAADQMLTGADYHNSFFFGGDDSGDDSITNFAADDIIVTDVALRDGNGDGIIGFGRNGILNTASGSVAITGTSALRFLGEACEGSFVYADAAVRPDGAQEGKVLSDDVLSGDAGDAMADIFFFDTALDLALGDDTIANFGANDILVTTTKVFDRNNDGTVGFGSDGILDLPGGVGGPGDPGSPGEGGMVTITNMMGGAVSALEYDGSVERDGVTYYVYSLSGSSAGLDTLG